MTSRQVVTFGFIPEDWSGSNNDDQRISVGDPETSKTKEFNIELVEDEDSNAKLIGVGDSRAINTDEFWDNKSELFKGLTKKVKADFGVKVMPKILQQLWALFQDELEDDVSKFVVVAEEDDGAEFVNDSGEHNGCIYARFYFEDEDAEMSREKVVVIRG